MRVVSIIIFLASVPHLFIASANTSNAVVNFHHHGSRLGDDLLGYCKAKWLAWQLDLPFYLKMFPHADALLLSQHEHRFSQSHLTYKKELCVQKKPINWLQTTNTLYYVSFRSKNINWSITNPDLDFVLFRTELRKMIYPKRKSNFPKIPSDMISVAVHVRTGSETDTQFRSTQQSAQQKWPLKFPPYAFYIEQIRYVYDYFGKQPLYVYIFTDNKEPKKIAQTFNNSLADCHIQFDYRQSKNNQNMRVIDDLIGLSIFNCLIRPNSNFSICAQLIGNHTMIIWPTSYHWNEATLVIDNRGIHMPSRT